MKGNNIFYDLSKILKHKKYLNMIIGQRGRGKTYNVKKKFIQEAIADKTGNSKFAWVKVTTAQIDKMISHKGFQKDIMKEGEFKGVNIYTKGAKIYADKRHIGTLFSLSGYSNEKSNAFDEISNFCIDEFVQDRNPGFNISFAFFDIIETIFRMRKRVNIFALCNTLTVDNWLFQEYKVYIPRGVTRCEMQGPNWALDLDDSEAFKTEKRKSPIGKLLAGTEYGKYSIENSFILDDSYQVERTPFNGSYRFSIYYAKVRMGIWQNKKNNQKWHVNLKNNTTGDTYYYGKENMKPGYIAGDKTEIIMFLYMVYMDSNLTFESQKVKNLVIEVFEKMHNKVL